MLMLAGAGLVAACAPAASPEIEAATANLDAGVVTLKSGDTVGIAGKWTGGYVMQTGYRGKSHLTITRIGDNTVDGVFEYFWGAGNYHRSPETGTYKGVIKPDGELHFDKWNLQVTREGTRLRMTTTQNAFGGRASFTWRKDAGPLPSETPAS